MAKQVVRFFIIMLVVTSVVFISHTQQVQEKAAWARIVLGSGKSIFNGAAADAQGNVYCAGFIDGVQVWDFGSGVKAAGSARSKNAIVVKYNSSGKALWAKSVSTGQYSSEFRGIAADDKNNVYAVGELFGNDTYTFGPGVSLKGAAVVEGNMVLIKYDSSGNAQWARTVTGKSGSGLSSVAVDSSGNIYCAGYIFGNEAYSLALGVTVAGPASKGMHAFIAKYNAGGTPLWARSAVAGSDSSWFKGVAVDSAGKVYTVGSIKGSGSYSFGPPAYVTGSGRNHNVVCLCYDSNGSALWAKSVSSGHDSQFMAVAIDNAGKIIAVGNIWGKQKYTFGDGVAVTGSNPSKYFPFNAVIVKYDLNGTALWAQTASESPDMSSFTGLAADNAGNIYAVGFLGGPAHYVFGENAAVNASGSVLIKYTSAGVPAGIQTISGAQGSVFTGAGIDSSGNIYAAGSIVGIATFDFGNRVTARGTSFSEENAFIVKYGRGGKSDDGEL